MTALMVGLSNSDIQPLITIVPSPLNNQVHEWLILFDREVEHIWRKDWNVSKVLFILSRYGVFLDIPITLASKSDPMHRVDRRGLTGISALLLARVAPYDTIDYDVGVNVVNKHCRPTNRNTPDM